MNSETTRQRTVEALREHSSLTAFRAEQYILIAAAQIIRECSIDELLAISVTTASTGDLWGARAMADAEIARREANAHGFIRGRRSAGTLSDSEGAPSDS